MQCFRNIFISNISAFFAFLTAISEVRRLSHAMNKPTVSSIYLDDVPLGGGSYDLTSMCVALEKMCALRRSDGTVPDTSRELRPLAELHIPHMRAAIAAPSTAGSDALKTILSNDSIRSIDVSDVKFRHSRRSPTKNIAGANQPKKTCR